MTPDRGSQMETQAPDRIWIDAIGIPDSAIYAGTYYLTDDDDHQTFEYVHVALIEAQSAQIATLQAEVERLGKIIAFKDRLIAVKDRHIDDAEKALDAMIERRRAEAAEARKGEAG